MIVKESDAGAWLLFTLCAPLKLEYETVIIRARSGELAGKCEFWGLEDEHNG